MNTERRHATTADTQLLPMLHLTRHGTAQPGATITTYCGKRLRVGHGADKVNSEPTAPHIVCPVCSAMQIINQAAAHWQQEALL